MRKQIEEILQVMRKIEENEQNQNHKIQAIRYLGEIAIDGKAQDIYFVRQIIQRQSNGELYEVEVDSYMTEELEKIAGNNRSDQYQYPMVMEKYTNQKESMEKQLKALGEEGLLDLETVERNRVKTIAKTMGVKEEEIKEIEEMDVKQEVKKEKKQETKKDVKGLNIKEETKLSQRIKGETLENKLGLKQHGIEDGVTLARVTSSSLNPYLDKAITQVDAFVVVRKNGEVVLLGEDILQPDNRLGTNPTQEAVTINVENGEVKEEPITSSWRIVNGNGRDYLSVGYDEAYGAHREIRYREYSPQDNQYLDIELETHTTRRQDEDVRRYEIEEARAGERAAQETRQKYEEHNKLYAEAEVAVEDTDHNQNNNTHTHEFNEQEYIPYTDVTWQEFANQCGYRGEGWLEKVYEIWMEERSKAENAGKDNQELIEKIQEEINEQYMPEREM